MLRDERADRLRYPVLLRELDPVANVRADYRRTRRGLELVVRISPARLILHEVLRLAKLADVVVVRADTSQQSVRADRIARRFGEIRHRNRVRVRAGRLEAQPSQQRLVEIRPSEPAKVVRNSAPTLRAIHEQGSDRDEKTP